MKVFYKKELLQEHLAEITIRASIGFIPTMGALHKGHLSLIEKANNENDISVVSIFVNPTQFDKKEDLRSYPRTIEEDLALLQTIKCDVVFVPSVSEIYDDNINALHFDFDGLEFEMEGKHRKGHFDGVGTIVKRFFEIVKPLKAYFGEKDFQQLQIIKKLVEKYRIPVQIIGCEIYREPDGLAMSSRNVRLTKAQRKEAPFIYKTLMKAKEKLKKDSIQTVIEWVEGEFKKNAVLQLEYFEIAHSKTLKPVRRKSKKASYRGFIAAFAGDIRLIDNIALN
ncbi:MAG TPA: pantoate--beta-alanine ligase [Flavobacteriia bacterium]|nr:pantoate--beta-alanine ligase [Flavobacteriia bacterium]